MSYLIEDDENVMKEASKRLKSLKNFIEESLPSESGIPLLKSKETHSSCVKPTAKASPVNTKLSSCENQIKFTDIFTKKHKNLQSNHVGEKKEKMVKASKISIPEIKKNSKAAISENKVEEDNIDYEDVAQFEAFDIFFKDPVNNNVEEESQCALNYSDLRDILENRMLNDDIVNALQKMLKKQFTEANGLQDPVLGQGLDF